MKKLRFYLDDDCYVVDSIDMAEDRVTMLREGRGWEEWTVEELVRVLNTCDKFYKFSTISGEDRPIRLSGDSWDIKVLGYLRNRMICIYLKEDGITLDRLPMLDSRGGLLL